MEGSVRRQLAMRVLDPFLTQLRKAIENHPQKWRRPVRIVVPMDFPEVCEDIFLWELPVERGEVQEPKVEFERGTRSAPLARTSIASSGPPALRSAGEASLPGNGAHGDPASLQDVRFQVRSSSDWGTSFFAMDPDEFLGEPTEDDHDWRDSAATYLD